MLPSVYILYVEGTLIQVVAVSHIFLMIFYIFEISLKARDSSVSCTVVTAKSTPGRSMIKIWVCKIIENTGRSTKYTKPSGSSTLQIVLITMISTAILNPAIRRFVEFISFVSLNWRSYYQVEDIVVAVAVATATVTPSSTQCSFLNFSNF